MTDSIPFPELTGRPNTETITVAPDGTVYVVPSGTHDRLRDHIVEDPQVHDPSVDLALAGWAILQCDGLTNRINADVPEDFANGRLIRAFAQAHDAGVAVIARHPSQETIHATDPQRFSFDTEEG